MTCSVDVYIKVLVRNTEVTDHVGNAVKNIFPGVELNREPGQLVGEIHELERFSERLHEQAILDTTRHEFVKRRDDDDFSFTPKKQAAFKDVVNFFVGNPDKLGNIEVYVTIRDLSVDEIINYVAPPTGEGRPVDPNDC